MPLKRTRLKRFGRARKRGKFGNVPRIYHGIEYHSKLEAKYASELDLRMQATSRVDRILSWRRQVSVKLEVNGNLICRYIVDFVLTHLDGREEYVEVKGFDTDVWKLKEKLFRAVYPDRQLTIVRA